MARDQEFEALMFRVERTVDSCLKQGLTQAETAAAVRAVIDEMMKGNNATIEYGA